MPEKNQSDHPGERRRITVLVIALVVSIAVVIGLFVVVAHLTGPRKVTAAQAGGSKYSVTIGDPNAPHSVVVYEDFLCPVCGELEGGSNLELQKLADQGKVYVDYRPYSLLAPSYSTHAAAAFYAVLGQVGPTAAKKFHDLLYIDQPPEPGPYPNLQWLVDKAVDAGAPEGAVETAIKTGAYDPEVTAATAAARAAGVAGTPTIILDGKVFTAGHTMAERAKDLVTAVS